MVSRYTQGKSSSVIYATVLKWPVDNLLDSACLDQLDIASILMIDSQSDLKVLCYQGQNIIIDIVFITLSYDLYL